jgi:hypothetical protein
MFGGVIIHMGKWKCQMMVSVLVIVSGILTEVPV